MNENFKFIVLTTKKGEITVNLDQVKYIRKNDEGRAVLVFSEGVSKSVQESYEEIKSCLPLIKPSEIG